MAQYAMVIDLRKCLGCHSCALACKAQWQVPAAESRCRLQVHGPGQTPEGLALAFQPRMCNQCDDPPCVPVCPVTPLMRHFGKGVGKTAIPIAATWKNPLNGIVEVDPARCIGCGACVKACPYEARYLKPGSAGHKTADKCDFCLELLEAGKEPVCVSNCLADAMFFGNLADSESAVSRYLQDGAVRLTVGAGSDPGSNVYYYGRPQELYMLHNG